MTGTHPLNYGSTAEWNSWYPNTQAAIIHMTRVRRAGRPSHRYKVAGR